MKRCAIISAVYGTHANLLDRTLATFATCPGCELHAFIFGDVRPSSPHPAIRYHQVPFTGAYGPSYREVNYRRWEVLQDFDHVAVVDGGDTYCIQPLPPLAEILDGKAAAAAVEYHGSRPLGVSGFTSTYFNAGVTFWDVARSAPLRQKILERGRARFRANTDDQLALNEVLHASIQEVRILPFLFNYHLHLKPRLADRYWPVARELPGVYILHTPDPVPPLPPSGPDPFPLEPVEAEASFPTPFQRRLRQWLFRLKHRC